MSRPEGIELWNDAGSIKANWGGTRDPFERVRQLWTGDERLSWGSGINRANAILISNEKKGIEAKLNLDDWEGIHLKYDKKGELASIDIRSMAFLYLTGNKRMIQVADGLDELHRDTLISIDLVSKKLFVGIEDEGEDVFTDIDEEIAEGRGMFWVLVLPDDLSLGISLKIEKKEVVMMFENVMVDINRHVDLRTVRSIRDIGTANDLLLNNLLKVWEV